MNPHLRRYLVFWAMAAVVPACGGGGGGGGGGGAGGSGGNVIVSGNQPPAVSLLSPSPNATFSLGSAVLLEAQTSDPDGLVVRVDFFDGAARIAAVVTGPFLFTWNSADAGAHSLTAIATDNQGATTVSLPVLIVVVAPGGGGTPVNEPPTVNLMNPVNGATFLEGTTISVEAEASDPEGSIARVDFFDGTTPLGTSTQLPWRILWSGAAPGPHSLRAVVIDGGGTSSSSSPVAITVFPMSTGGGGTPPPPTPTPSPPQGMLRGVFFASTSRGWTVGDGGGIWRTLDGGTTWFRQTSGTTAALNRVQFVSSELGWVVGTGGTILRTEDGGDHWSARTSGTANELRAVSFVSGSTGWAVGREGTILKTTDGGLTWTPQNAGFGDWGAASFVSPSAGWVGGIGISSTSNGGADWTSYPTEFMSFTGIPHLPDFFDARFINATRGTFVGVHRGGDVIFTTTDAGATWTILQPHDNFARLHGVAFGDPTHFWAVGSRGPFAAVPSGTILASVDGGLTWTDQISPTAQTLNGVWFVSATTGWAVGDGGTVIRTTNGGATWTVLSTGS